jgi:hypothetical protein
MTLAHGMSGRLTDPCARGRHGAGLRSGELTGKQFRSGQGSGIRNSEGESSFLFTKVFADGLRHLEHIQSGFSKDWFQLFIGYDLTPLLWVLQFVLFDVGPHFFRNLRPGYRSG